MFSGVQKIELTNSDSTLLTFNKISANGEVYTKEPLTVEAGSGSQLYAGSDNKIEFVSYDVEHFDTLETWMENEKEVTAKVYGNNIDAIWNELAPITVEKLIETMTGKLLAFRVVIQIKGEYNNILAVSPYNWTDGNGNYFVEETVTNTEILLYKR